MLYFDGYKREKEKKKNPGCNAMLPGCRYESAASVGGWRGRVGAYFNVKFTKERTRESIEEGRGGEA